MIATLIFVWLFYGVAMWADYYHARGWRTDRKRDVALILLICLLGGPFLWVVRAVALLRIAIIKNARG